MIAGLLASTPTVHTSGINWGSVLTIIGGVAGAFIAAIAFLDNRQENRQKSTKDQISEAVNHLSDVLIERLETKENVGQLRIELAHVEEKLTSLSAQRRQPPNHSCDCQSRRGRTTIPIPGTEAR